MFAGHVGAALALGRSEQRVNIVVFVVAALLLDVVLWLFVLLGWESVLITPAYGVTHQPEFVFPLSHGLAASVAWAIAAGLVIVAACARLGTSRRRAAVLIAATVFSHWVLDALVHRPELPVAGPGSATVGLGLWQHMPFALAVEASILLGGLTLYVHSAPFPRARKAWLVALSLFILASTIAGMTIAPPPPSALAMASSSLVTIAILCALVGWLARPSRVPQA